MKLQQIDRIITYPDKERACITVCRLVKELLAMTLFGQKDGIMFDPLDFHYNPGNGIKATESLSIVVHSKNVYEEKQKIALTLSGTAKNVKGHTNVFTLFFAIPWKNKRLPEVIYNYKKPNESCPLIVVSKNPEEKLFDTLFELDLYQQIISSQQKYLGRGRGYLFFEPIIQPTAIYLC